MKQQYFRKFDRITFLEEDETFENYKIDRYGENSMLLQQNSKSLALEINNAILRQNRNAKSFPHNHINCNINNMEIFVLDPHDLRGEAISGHEIKLEGEEFMVIKDYLLLKTNDIIRIYKWKENVTLKLIKTIRSHLLLFLIKTGSINKNVRLVFYRIILVLIRNKIKRVDSFLEGILFYLNIDYLENIEICDKRLICYYMDGSIKTYDGCLNEIENFDKCYKSVPKIDNTEQIVYDNISVIINEKSVEIIHNDKSFYEKFRIEDILQCCYTSKYLFLLTKTSIKVLEFNKT
ncbi:hypothetical protein TCON_0075 [Astathelohania contejeani]|uniref:Uncharacterized protein n=1 Tax=Astathelohania contejeani TaxID=164912 RepID=A0ABQ7I2P1_9MICR|nr:hypothetical protein TCON_0075 [Thelohania contejeani]